MQRLLVREHIYLTDNVIKVLAQNRITTILDFLQEDTEKLSNLTKLTLPQIIDVRNYILNKYSAPVVKATSLLDQNVTKKKYISYGIESLDAVTSGGIPVGNIIEVCGLPDSGKTQLCMQISINAVKNSDNVVLYVDTKGDFSATRIQKILDAYGYSYKD
ncbi:DNA repair protein RAD51 homolog 4 isoform X2 [Pectinophora gossypiella]|uniref:DNA repair protein RAD51 homolog 4 isoform X2 n=1 Tax=Pectinophora gossypiella TaxID=13191 RepID=UPI00214ED750|nr:DNA repair protein RAD51 homolog 4 isoform X2 [Pectinophora gossypiella]